MSDNVRVPVSPPPRDPLIRQLPEDMLRRARELLAWYESLPIAENSRIRFGPDVKTQARAYPNPWFTIDGRSQHSSRLPEDFKFDAPFKGDMILLTEPIDPREPKARQYDLEIPLNSSRWNSGSSEVNFHVGLPLDGSLWDKIFVALWTVGVSHPIEVTLQGESANASVVGSPAVHTVVSRTTPITVRFAALAVILHPVETLTIRTPFVPAGDAKLLIKGVSCYGRNPT